MTTLYIRDVDDAVAEELKVRAADQGLSLSAYVAAELTKLASRPTNEQVVERIRSRRRGSGPSRGDILHVLSSARR